MKSIVTLLALISGILIGNAQVEAAQVFKIYLESPGVYRVTYERLNNAGLASPSIVSSDVALKNRGHEVSFWIEDGGDGVFEAGDWIEFVAEQLPGEASYLNEFSRFNCYFLTIGSSAPVGADERLELRHDGSSDLVEARHHLENDVLMLRYKENQQKQEEQWYWKKISVADREVDALEIRFPDLATHNLDSLVTIRLSLRGWSEPRKPHGSELRDHRIIVTLNELEIGQSAWDGKDHHVVDFAVPADMLDEAQNRLELKVPKRFFADSGDLLIDVVVLNWIEVEYPLDLRVESAQERLYSDHVGVNGVSLASRGKLDLHLYDPNGTRYAVTSDEASGIVDVRIPEQGLWLVPTGALHDPEVVIVDQPSQLTHRSESVDYIMIAHQSLIKELLPLVELHTRRGLNVDVVDVQDIFDEFNYGIVHPRAIRDFLDQAYHDWPRPAPKFVLLVGDASWDYKNTRAEDKNYADWWYIQGEKRYFVKNSMTPYSGNSNLNDRNLVPTWDYPSHYGHAASDNWFVCLDGEDAKPEMAIGRIPVVSPQELKGVVDKTIGYVERTPVGPWRRRTLFITNESIGFQAQTDRIAEQIADAGYVAEKVYPKALEKVNEHHSERLIQLFDEGLQWVLFLGHGGRYIWRTGPPDLKKNHDLFTLDHLDQLQPTNELPIVISLTCYSAPFDHPSADSIGEKLLRMPDKGAIGVFAASWRNSPSAAMGHDFFEEMARPGMTIGEAVMLTKRKMRSEILMQTYNLLGDPAVPGATPMSGIAITVQLESKSVRGTVGIEDFSGQAVVDAIREDGSVVASEEVPVNQGVFEWAVPPEMSWNQVAAVRAYAWNEEHRVDAIGSVKIDRDNKDETGDGTS